MALLRADEVPELEDVGPMILGLINTFLNSYGDKIEGRFVKEIAVECQGGSRINYIFHEIFNKVINSIDPFEYLTDQDIQTAMKNSSSLSPSLFVPEGAFEVLIRQQIARLLEPSLDCSYEVYEELRKIVISIQIPELTRYYRLQSKICDVMESVLDQCLTPTTEMIANLIEIENAHINTNHPDFVGSADSLLNLFSGDESGDEPNQKGGSHSLLSKTPGSKRKDLESESGLGDDAQIIGEDGESEKPAEEEKSSGYLGGYMPTFMGGGKSKKKSKSKELKESGATLE